MKFFQRGADGCIVGFRTPADSVERPSRTDRFLQVAAYDQRLRTGHLDLLYDLLKVPGASLELFGVHDIQAETLGPFLRAIHDPLREQIIRVDDGDGVESFIDKRFQETDRIFAGRDIYAEQRFVALLP